MSAATLPSHRAAGYIGYQLALHPPDCGGQPRYGWPPTP